MKKIKRTNSQRASYTRDLLGVCFLIPSGIPEQEATQKKNGKALNKDRQIAVICNVLLTCRIWYCKVIAQFVRKTSGKSGAECTGRSESVHSSHPREISLLHKVSLSQILHLHLCDII